MRPYKIHVQSGKSVIISGSDNKKAGTKIKCLNADYRILAHLSRRWGLVFKNNFQFTIFNFQTIFNEIILQF